MRYAFFWIFQMVQEEITESNNFKIVNVLITIQGSNRVIKVAPKIDRFKI